MRSFIIHMSSSTARRHNAEQLCASLPNGELVEAVNGRDPQQINSVDLHPGSLYRPHYPFALRPAEIGVFQSHRKIWQMIVDQNLDYALITEDDLQIDPLRFASALQILRTHATADSYIRLPVKQREKPAQVLAEQDGQYLILPKTIGLQCICQVVGGKAAQRLLAATSSIDRPVDTFLQLHWLTNQPVHALLGVGNREVAAQIGGSTIQSHIPARHKLARELKRGLYRARLWAQSQKPQP
ncbi:glycosyl transferase family 25 [Rhodobacterales bacterium 56_14_T64]|nr:glycosyl transferase family 25 [Rhodobacterales bacterium 56_14_T64]